MIFETISKYHLLSRKDEHHRYKSWEHCFNFFSEHKGHFENEKEIDLASLNLAFYLASWGMLRGGAFLLQKDYRIHQYLIRETGLNMDYGKFYSKKFLETVTQESFIGIDNLIQVVRNAYVDNIDRINDVAQKVSVSDTLASKIILGMYGIVPAYDRYFIVAMKMHGLKNTSFTEGSLNQFVMFYNDYKEEFNKSKRLFEEQGITYTPMKMIDMYFWQVGFMMENPTNYSDNDLEAISAFAESNLRFYADKNPGKTMTIGQTEEIRQYIFNILQEALEGEQSHVDLVSGDIHKDMNLINRMPSVCNAMTSLEKNYNIRHEIIHNTPSGMSSTKKVRYWLER